MFAIPKSLSAQGCEVDETNRILDCSTGTATFQITTVAGLTSIFASSPTGFTGTFTASLGAGTMTVSAVNFSNYKGFGRFTLNFEYSSGLVCALTVKIAECCASPVTYDYLFIDEAIPATTYSGSIWCYGDISIPNNTVFDAAEILNGVDAQFHVQSGATVEFTSSSTIDKLCEYRWDGIYLSGAGSELIINGNTLVGNACQAVYAENNATVELVGSTFQDNITSLKIEDYTTQGSYYNSHIKVDDCDFSFTAALTGFNIHPSSPLTTTVTDHFKSGCSVVSGGYTVPVFILNSNHVNIGHRVYGPNTFSSPSADITFMSLENSRAFIRNNTFGANVEYAVCSNSQSLLMFGGSNPAAGNTFNSSVVSYNSTDYFQNNDINANITINTPEFDNILTGVFEDATNFIDNNFDGAKLTVNGNNQNTQVRVISNDFTNSHVELRQLAGVSSPALRGIIFNDNDMNYTGSATIYNPLKIYQCYEGVVGDNNFTNLTSHTPTTNTGAAGIYIDGMVDGQVTLNNINRFSRGIYLANNFGTTQFQCNVLDRNYEGIYIYYADLDDQGDASNATMNQWTNTGATNLAGQAQNAIDWYHSSGAIYTPNSVTNVTPVPFASTLICSSITIPQKSSPIKNPIEVFEIKTYPNPATSSITIKFPKLMIGQTCKVFLPNGQVVAIFKVVHLESEINIASWAIGLYFIEVSGKTARFIKQ